MVLRWHRVLHMVVQRVLHMVVQMVLHWHRVLHMAVHRVLHMVVHMVVHMLVPQSRHGHQTYEELNMVIPWDIHQKKNANYFRESNAHKICTQTPPCLKNYCSSISATKYSPFLQHPIVLQKKSEITIMRKPGKGSSHCSLGVFFSMGCFYQRVHFAVTAPKYFISSTKNHHYEFCWQKNNTKPQLDFILCEQLAADHIIKKSSSQNQPPVIPRFMPDPRASWVADLAHPS